MDYRQVRRELLNRYALLSIIGLISLINLTRLEIQPSDEGYYALRAKAILDFEYWLDQTDYSIGGFHSSSHPPLLIWLMALAAKVFGLNNFSLRIWSWVSFMICVWIVGETAAQTNSKKDSALVAMLVFGLSPLVIWYGRLAQFDMLVTMLSALQGLFYLRFLKTQKIVFLALCGGALGLALLSKTLVGIFAGGAIGLHSLALFWRKELSLKEFLRNNAIIFGIGLSLGLSWFIGLCLVREGFFERYVDWFIVDRVLRNQTHASHITGIFYYFNVVLTRFPLVAFSTIWIWKFAREKEYRTGERTFFLIWFLLPFIAFSVASTKLIWYALIFVPPLALIVSESILIFFETPFSSIIRRNILILLGFTSVWSLTQVWHRSIALFLTNGNFQDETMRIRCLILVCLLILSISILLWIEKKLMTKSILMAAIPLVAILASLQTVLYQLPANVPLYHGISEMKRIYEEQKPSHLIHILKDDYPDEYGVNPQFSYYFSGIDVDRNRWKIETKFSRFTIDEAKKKLLVALDESPDALIIVEKFPSISSEFNPPLQNLFQTQAQELELKMIAESGKYIAYRK